MDESKTPYHAKPYRIPVAHVELMKRAINDMVENDTLMEYTGDSEWAAPTFGVPKKNEGIRIVSDFRRLNEAIKRNPWPMPTIQDMLHQCGGMTFATALDMIMSYYAMSVKKDLRKYLVIILPWGKYVYKKMPMGLKVSADIFQRELSSLFQDMHFVLVYIDDILVITKGSYEQHLYAVRKVLEKLRDAGMQLNLEKSYFAKESVEYLGYIISRKKISPHQKRCRS